MKFLLLNKEEFNWLKSTSKIPINIMKFRKFLKNKYSSDDIEKKIPVNFDIPEYSFNTGNYSTDENNFADLINKLEILQDFITMKVEK